MWLLAEGSTDKHSWRLAQRRLQAAYAAWGADPAVATDESRVLRLVPYPNRKYGRQTPTSILWESETRYILQDLLAAYQAHSAHSAHSAHPAHPAHPAQPLPDVRGERPPRGLAVPPAAHPVPPQPAVHGTSGSPVELGEGGEDGEDGEADGTIYIGVPGAPRAPGAPDYATPVQPLTGDDDRVRGLSPDMLRQLVADEEQRRQILHDFIWRNLRPGVDYGVLPPEAGIMSLAPATPPGELPPEPKPVLFKPGGEKVCTLLQLRPDFAADTDTLSMLGSGPGVFAYVCRLVDRRGRLVGQGRGVAELRERPGWTVNIAVKLAQKRAMIDAVLRVAGLSELFSQELDDPLPPPTTAPTADGAASGRPPVRQPQPSMRSVPPHPPGSPRSPGSPGPSQSVQNTQNTHVLTGAEWTRIVEQVRRTQEVHASGPGTGPGTGYAAVPGRATARQVERIRALLPKAGVVEEDLVDHLRISSLYDPLLYGQ